jgi:hypothetical protein
LVHRYGSVLLTVPFTYALFLFQTEDNVNKGSAKWQVFGEFQGTVGPVGSLAF